MLTEDVCGIFRTFDVVKCKDAGSDGFPNVMEGQGIVSFMEFGVWDGGAVHNRLVVSEHVCLLPNRNTKIL